MPVRRKEKRIQCVECVFSSEDGKIPRMNKEALDKIVCIVV